MTEIHQQTYNHTPKAKEVSEGLIFPMAGKLKEKEEEKHRRSSKRKGN